MSEMATPAFMQSMQQQMMMPKDTMGANFWLSVLTDLQNRGVEDILIACIDGLQAVSYTHLDVYKRQSVSNNF